MRRSLSSLEKEREEDVLLGAKEAKKELMLVGEGERGRCIMCG